MNKYAFILKLYPMLRNLVNLINKHSGFLLLFNKVRINPRL